MKIYAPSYFKDFKCIGGACKHNCCIGWEIDIDTDTLQKYKNTEGVFKKRFLESIDTSKNEPHFILGDKERCPFLNGDNMCDIICHLGEDYLCEICNAHPRYRNFFSDREEIGIGMCCEEAARIILTQKTDPFLVYTKVKGRAMRPSREEKRVIRIKKRLLREVSSHKRAEDILCALKKYGSKDISSICARKCKDLFMSLEILDDEWRRFIYSIDPSRLVFNARGYERELKNLLFYFIFRHISYNEYEKSIEHVVDFCIFSALFLVSVCTATEKSLDEATEICRMYSAEIEYSRENTNVVLDALERGLL